MLELTDVHSYYGNIHALKGVSLKVDNGEIVGRSPGVAKNEFLKSHYLVSDFRLEVKVRVTPDKEHGGIYFRSVALPGGGSVLPRINGSRPRTNEYMYDGISVLQPEPGQVVYYPVIDGIAEFKLNVNAYSPEYGRSNGGTVMVLGKSGTNRFHGNVFEFFRNEALNARNFFAQPGPKPEFRRNIYGGTFGGPIQSNKTFFFGDWQGTRLRTGVTRFSVVPTLAQRQGIFTQSIFDPATWLRLRRATKQWIGHVM